MRAFSKRPKWDSYLNLVTSVLSTQLAVRGPVTVTELQEIGFTNIADQYFPDEIFSEEALFSVKGFLILLLSGVCIGFGTRYAGGCTSGHAITGLSSLQLPSLKAVIGFFIGGIIAVWFIIPNLF